MNKSLYRVVFNRARGIRMVVQETAASDGKGTNKATSGPAPAAPARVAAAVVLFGALVALPGQAQIVGAPNVPGSLRPTVLMAPNGVPLINIQSPSAAGVSRNVYNQLNVGSNGAIFNNSRTNAQTQLGGIVQGNPFLARGPARIILNEVNGGNLSQLRGYMEVAGQRAEIIIANPAGINVDGAGFINANRATLTTGTPQLNALGGLDSFLVRGGTITIKGAGLDASKTDYAAILARAVQANAGIWASELKVVTGANQVSADHSQIASTAGAGAAPTFALDVAALGGMYAGKIVLVGTEAGLGVRNAGTIQAAPGTPALAGAGQLVVTSAGRLENIGTIQATADASIAASSLANSGRISSGGNLKVATQDTLANSFNGTGGTLEGARVELASAAGSIDNRSGGTIRQTSNAALEISAPVLSNTSGGVIGLEPIPETPSQPAGGANPGTGSGTATPGTPATGGGTGSGSSTITPAPYVPPSPGTITAANAILNDGGRIYAGGPITLQSANINNNGGTMSLASMTVNQPTFDNHGGTLNISNGFSANVDRFDNSGGKLNAGSLNIATSGDLINVDGTLTSASDTTLTVSGKADNTRGTISATGVLNANVAGATNNTGGTLASNQGLRLDTGSLDNTKGSIQSAQAGVQIAVSNQLVNGNGGTVNAATDLNVQAGSLGNGGSLRGGNDVSVAVGDALTNDGSITAGRHTTITAGNLQSSTTGVLGAGVQNDGTLGAAGDLRVTTSGALVANGNNVAAGNATLQGASVDVSGSQTSAAHVAVTVTQGNVTTSKATIVTPGTLSVTAHAQPGQTLVNEGGKLNANRLDLKVSNIANTQGGEIVQTGTGATRITTSGVIDNSSGTLASNGSLAFTAASLNNKGGTLRAAQTSDLTLTVDGLVDNRRGEMSAGGNATLQAGSLDNDAGRVTAAGDASSTTSSTTSNKGGTIAANGNTTLNAGSLDNAGGTVSALNTLTANVQGAVDNTTGTLIANQTLVLDAGSLVNDKGAVQSTQAAARLNAGGALNNGSGVVGAATDLGIKAGTLANAGSLRGGNDASVAVGGQLANDGNITAGRNTTIKAGSVQSGSTGVLGAGIQSDGKLGTTGDLSVSGDGALVAHGTNVAAGNATLQGASVDLSGSQTSAANIAIAAKQGDLTTSKATVVTPGTLSVTANGNAAQTLVNDAGKLSAKQLDLKLSNLANTNGGEIVQTGTGATTIAMSGTLNNDGARIASNGQSLVLQANAIKNTAGKIEHAGTGTLNIAGGNYGGANGQVTTNGALVAAMKGTFNQDGGKAATTAKQITIDAGSLSNRGGQIVQTGAGATAITARDTLNNDTGRIASNGQDLTLRAASITSNAGKIEHAGTGTLTIAGGSYNGAARDGTAGRITSNGSLVAALSSAFNQDGGETSAKQITIDAGSLSNRGGQIVQTGGNATRITVAGVLDNSNQGTIASNGNTTIAAGSLINQGGAIRAAEASSLGLTVGGLLDNSNKGVIGAGGNTTVAAGSLNNNGGRVTAVGRLDATVGGVATNLGGTLAANGNTTLVAGTLDNSGGTTAAVKGDLSVTTSGITTNNKGTLQGGAKATLVSGGLINTGGTVFGESLSVDTGGKALDNSKKGTLAATTTVDVRSGALNNDTGLIQSGGAMTINTDGKKLTNTNAAGYTNKQGGIASANTLTLKNVGEVDNAAGFIGSKNALDAKTQAFSNTGGGTVLGQATVAVNTNGAGYDNSGGQTMAVGDLTVDAGSVTNAGGLIRSMATTTLRADTVDNANTRGAEQGIEGKNVNIAARSIGNHTGTIRADENVALTSKERIDNTSGLVSAGATLTVKDPGTSKSLSVVNTGGTLIAGKKVVLDAGSVTWDGKLLSLGDMDLAVTKDIAFAAGSETVANNNLSISTTGDITNNGKLAAGKDLTLTAKDINNTATGDIQGKTTTLNASGTLTNRGVIDGSVTRINAGVLNNYGTGRIYGDRVSIGAGTLNNDVDPASGAASAGTIAARSRLDIGAGTVNNRNGALIFSDGDLLIGGKLVDGKAVDSAGTLNNHAATVEATQNVNIKTSVLNNTNGGVTWTTQTQSDGTQHTEFALPGSTTRYEKSQLVFVTINGTASSPVMAQINGVLWPSFDSHSGPVTGQFSGILVPSASYPLSRYKAYYANPPRNSSTLAGSRPVGTDGSESFTEPGAWYSRTDPIWARFGVASPATDTPDDAQREAYLEAHKRLDTATAAFIADVYANYARSYYYWVYTESTTTPVLQTSAPGRIIAGGKMDIAVGSGTNEMSQILAGGALNVTGGKIENRNVEVSGSQTRNGWQLFQAGGGGGEQASLYNTSVPITVTLAAARQEGNVAVVGSGTATGNLSPGYTDQGVARASGVSGSTPASVGGSTSTAVNAPDTALGSGAGAASGAQANAAIGGAAVGGTSGVGGSGANAVTTGTGSPVVSPIVQVRLAASSGTEQIARTTLPGLSLPTASLFRSHPEASSRYLIETDPRFASYRNWLSSDYLLNNLGQDPNNTLKRLGDGFYEQRLVREQVAQLTGYRYLGGYDSDDKQYAALMDAGVTFAKQYGLRPGIALSDAQMAQLTSDIVWLVAQTVTLSDGSTQRVLVPQVYVRVKNGDIDGSGALLAGKEVNIKLDGDLVNSGTVAGRETVKISAQNIQNLNGRISGGSLDLNARADLNNIGGTIDAASQLKIDAGRDINVRTTTSSSGLALDVSPGAVSLRGATIVDRVAGLYVSDPKGVLVASAGRDVNLIGAIVSNSGKEGTTEIGAGRDLNLKTVTTARQDASWRDTRNFRAEVSTQEVGTRIETSGDISLHAKRDVNVRAGTINSADGALEVAAKRNINIVEGNSGSALNEMRYESDSSFLGSDTSLQRGTSSGTQVIGSSLGGKTVTLDAGNDIRIRGSSVVSDKGTELWADNNITIEAAKQNKASDFTREESRSGMFDASSGWTWGQQQSSSSGSREQSTAVGSTVGAIGGNVIITAGNQYRQVGSDVIAPGGDVDIQARNVRIVEARETSRSDSKQSFSQSGITLGMKAPLIDMLRNLEDTTQAMRDTSSDRVKALGAASTALSGYSGYQDIAQQAATQNKNGTGAVSMGATLTIGSSSSESTHTQSSDTSAGSRVQAGGNVTITATGGGRDSNILVRGSQIDAGKNGNLAADNSVALEAAANTQKQSSTSRSSNSSVGVGMSFGETNGFSLEVAAGSQRGRDSGTDGAWANTTVNAGQEVNIASGGDTSLRGATVGGKRINADVGGNLRIETLQDTSTYNSQNSGAGFSGSFCIYMCSGGGVSVSAHNMRGDGDFASATKQSGFFAGDSGFGVKVAGNTSLVGGAIASTDAAVDGGKNSFATGSLTMTDLVNHDIFQGSGYSVSVSTSGSPGVGIGDNDVNQSSVTQSGISGIAGNTNVRTGVDSTNALRQTNAQRAMAEVQAEVYLTSTFGPQATRFVAQYAQDQLNKANALLALAQNEPDPQKRRALEDQATQIISAWAEGGTSRGFLHLIVGGLTGGAGGAAGAAASALVTPQISALLEDSGTPPALRVALLTLTGTLIGGVGGAAGAAAGFNEVTNNGLGTVIKRVGIAAVAFCLKDSKCLELTGATGVEILRQAELRRQSDANLSEENALLLALTDYGASTITGRPASPLPPPDPMVNVPIRPDQAGGTSTSGDVLPGHSTPGYDGTNPTGGNTSTTTTNYGPMGWILMTSQGTGSPSTPQSIGDIDGTTVFTQPSQGQRNSGQNAGVRLGEWGEGEYLAGGLLNQLSPGGRPIQNSSGNGADYIGGNIDHSKKEIPGFEVKTTDTGNRQPVGDLPVRMEDWIKEAAANSTISGKPISPSDQAYAFYLNSLLLQGYTIKPYVVEVAVPAQGQTGRPTIQVTPWPVPRGTSRPRIAPP
ncbi:filamentous hemagglutinin [Variovorax boronicumulans]|uniref:hemagglutinin repeat-containing protein n=1 Tax=Variovorax boronicumulans TaxID=436515 RepID=UPI00278A431D|nr:hemagglutinin repeat-containing protein [Variovorax boronicumulans]MDQ0015403.1 filamentous hemagglutinin [Variovorax boronicumulans]